MMRIVQFLLLAFLLLPTYVSAELSEDVVKDFSVIEGYVIMQINGQYLVDLDDRNNLNVGDILTIIQPGKKVLHPVTKEVVGSIDTPGGFLQVTRVHSGYSYVKPLEENLSIADGTAVKRFEQVPARLDGASVNADLARQLTVNLPHLSWLPETDASQALLSFTIDEGALEVRDAGGVSLHKYFINEQEQLVDASVVSKRPFVAQTHEKKPLLLQQLANSISDVFEKSNEDRFAEMDEAIIRNRQVDRKGIWMSPNLAGHPVGLAVADLDGDKQQELATIIDSKLKIARVLDGQFTELAEVEIPASLDVLSIDAVDLNQDGLSELYLSAMHGHRVSSFVVKFEEGVYKIVNESIKWFLRAVELPAKQGVALVGQKMGNEAHPFAGEMFYVESSGNELVQGEPISLPEQLNLFNFMPFADEQNQQHYVYLTRGDYLKTINGNGEELFESNSYFGGSEVSFNTRAEFKDELLKPIYVNPRMFKMPGGEILVAQNDGQRMVQRFRRFNNSRIVALTWNGFILNEVWRTASQPGYLAEFTVADADNDGQDEIVMVVKLQHGGMTTDARSAVVMYELDN